MFRQIQIGKIILLLVVMILISGVPAIAQDKRGIDSDVKAALKSLYRTTPSAKTVGGKAKAILVFPKIVKAGFIGGVQYGEGALIQDNKIVGYYNIAAASYGLQAGIQSFGYAMFFMTDSALQSLNDSAGFEIGTGPSVVVVDAGKARTLTTTTLRKDVYAFIFGQKGLMAGFGLQGSKISRIGP